MNLIFSKFKLPAISTFLMKCEIKMMKFFPKKWSLMSIS